jgi:hypothetical protein
VKCARKCRARARAACGSDYPHSLVLVGIASDYSFQAGTALRARKSLRVGRIIHTTRYALWMPRFSRGYKDSGSIASSARP